MLDVIMGLVMLRINMMLNWLLHLRSITNNFLVMKSKTRLRVGRDRLTGIRYSKCPRKTLKQKAFREVDEDLKTEFLE